MKATETSLVSDPPLVLDGRYEIEERLGGGGASDVYRAKDLRLGRSVAVKMFRTRAGAHSDRRCGDEARLLAALNHTGLVALYDVGWHDDREYLVMQLVEGRTLGRRIAAGALPPRDVVRVGAVLSDVLHHVHARGIVHRDVKPSNVLCADEGSVFLADFGISHPTGAEETDCSGVVVGTAPYLAPEQVQGGRVGPPCDVYALGLVLLECLTGKREYPGGQLEAAMARLHREPVVPDHTPAPLGRLIRSMTALDPSRRPTALQCRKLLAVHDPQMAASIERPAFMMAPAAPDSSELPTAEVVVASVSEEIVIDDVEQPDEDVETGQLEESAAYRRGTGAHRRRRGPGLWSPRSRTAATEARAS
ncbi:serine/threonine-protein kinase [Cryptosporangium sp. NPDC048952]|uniref:serine/threonine-protein kinase n=1 Tax=Cryptosporangium sp. NPDC048952 TaxID=3363961 RepID=UPI00371DFDC2